MESRTRFSCWQKKFKSIEIILQIKILLAPNRVINRSYLLYCIHYLRWSEYTYKQTDRDKEIYFYI